MIPSRLNQFIRFIIWIPQCEGGFIQNHFVSVIPLFWQGSQRHRPWVDDKIPRNITQVVVIGIEPIRAALSRDLNLVSVGASIARGIGIYSSHTNQYDRVDHLSVWKHTVDIAIKIGDSKGRLIQNHRLSVGPLLLRGDQHQPPLIHYQVTRNITQIVVIGIESIRAGLSRDLNLVSVGVSIARGGDIHSCGTNECDRVDHFSVWKHAIAIEIRHRKCGLIQDHGIPVSPLLLRGR